MSGSRPAAPGPERRIREVVGRGIPVFGNDMDTDRITPARYLKAVSFEGLEAYVFKDDREQDPEHPFNQDAYREASVLIGGTNFGCGSSREHAPQALRRWGIRGIVAGSFGEIFFGNSTTLGIVCVAADESDLDWLQRTVAQQPRESLTIDLDKREIRFAGRTIPVRVPDGTRSQLLSGTWDAMGILLEAGDDIERTAHRLPYVAGY